MTKTMTVDEIIAILTTPIDFEPLKAEAAAIKADLDRIGTELDKIDEAIARLTA